MFTIIQFNHSKIVCNKQGKTFTFIKNLAQVNSWYPYLSGKKKLKKIKHIQNNDGMCYKPQVAKTTFIIF